MIPTIIGVCVLSIIVGAVIAKMIIDRKNGKGGCSCGCGGCANREFCHPDEKKKAPIPTKAESKPNTKK